MILCRKKKGGMVVNDLEKQMNLPKEYVSCVEYFLKYSMFIVFDKDRKLSGLGMFGIRGRMLVRSQVGGRVRLRLGMFDEYAI